MQFTKLKRLIKTLCEALRRNREKGAITVMETLIALVIGTAVLSAVFCGNSSPAGCKAFQQPESTD